MLRKRIMPAPQAVNTDRFDPYVRLIKPSPRQPETPIERLTVAALRHGNATSLSSLINRVARELYLEELAMGAGLLDIGLFGPHLFAHDVAVELRAGNGVLWHIELSQ